MLTHKKGIGVAIKVQKTQADQNSLHPLKISVLFRNHPPFMETSTPAAKFNEAITNHSPFEPL